MFLAGEVVITSVKEKEFEGKKYFKCQAMANDGCVYSLSLPYSDNPKGQDVYQMIIEPSDRDFKAQARYEKVK